jgi:O-antigen ligase
MLAAWRLRLRPAQGELPLALLAGALTAVMIFATMHKLGAVGALFVPLLVPLMLALIANPLWMAGTVVGLVILFEGPDFGLFSFGSKLYMHATVLNVLVALIVLSVAIDMVRKRRRLVVPFALGLPLGTLVLGMIVGIVVGHGTGISLGKEIHSENLLMYLVFLPIAIANLDLSREQIVRLLGALIALAVLKAFLGLVEVGGHFGVPIEGHSTITYYEPTANWMMMVALLTIVALFVSDHKPALWMSLAFPLLIAAIVLSYRRSFWIGAVLAAILVVLIGLNPGTRRLLIPSIVFVVAAVWLAGSVHFQSQSTQSESPIVHRIQSLVPSKLTTNVEDRYRLDERANVTAEIRAHPITGIGMGVPWSAAARPLSIEHEGGRLYVHFAALWYWLKLGILGFAAYLGLLIGAALMSWKVWHTSKEPLIRAFGLASLCGMVGLAVIETTGSFTGVDARFTVLIAAHIGGLALLSREKGPGAPPNGEGTWA